MASRLFLIHVERRQQSHQWPINFRLHFVSFHAATLRLSVLCLSTLDALTVGAALSLLLLLLLLVAIWRTSVSMCSCWDYIEIFPFLREPVIENSTNPDYIICNHTAMPASHAATETLMSAINAANVTATMATPTIASARVANSMSSAAFAANNTNLTSSPLALALASTYVAESAQPAAVVDGVDAADLRANEFIYSAGKVFGIRVRFQRQKLPPPTTVTATKTTPASTSTPSPQAANAINDWILNITGEYRFLKKEHFKNDGRLIPGSYCDYYFFADANAKPKSLDIWQYFHSPRFPAKYPAHIKCAYKFIGRPESRVEIILEELHIPKQGNSCNMDKLTIFDSESANMNAVIDVICDALPTRRIISSGPDLLIEFNASSNVTAKGFRGKFKFLHNPIAQSTTANLLENAAKGANNSGAYTTERVIALEKVGLKKQTTNNAALSVTEWGKFFRDNVFAERSCIFIFTLDLAWLDSALVDCRHLLALISSGSGNEPQRIKHGHKRQPEAYTPQPPHSNTSGNHKCSRERCLASAAPLEMASLPPHIFCKHSHTNS